MDARLQKEVNDLTRKLRKISLNAKKESQSIFKQAAGPLVSAIQGRAPESDAPHGYYDGGTLKATFYPGNLKRSFKTLVFRQSPAVFVGPRVDKRTPSGSYKGARASGYYAHWIEFGAPGAGIPPRPFVKPAVQAAGALTLRLATQLLKRTIERGTI